MGSLPRTSRISDQEIIARYRAGEGRGILALRAGIGDSMIVGILTAAGVPLRNPSEVKAMIAKSRLATLARRARR